MGSCKDDLSHMEKNGSSLLGRFWDGLTLQGNLNIFTVFWDGLTLQGILNIVTVYMIQSLQISFQKSNILILKNQPSKWIVLNI